MRVTQNSSVLWQVTPYCLEIFYNHFGRTNCLHLTEFYVTRLHTQGHILLPVLNFKAVRRNKMYVKEKPTRCKKIVIYW